MFIFNLFKSQAKQSIHLSGEYKNLPEDLKKLALSKTGKDSPAVDPLTTKDQYRHQYRGIQRAARIQLFLFFVLVLLTTYNISDLLLMLMGLASVGISLTIYTRLSFMSWRARKVFAQWEKRHESLPMYFKEFAEEIEMNWKEILPLNIE